jgi:hypothetical protein
MGVLECRKLGLLILKLRGVGCYVMGLALLLIVEWRGVM